MAVPFQAHAIWSSISTSSIPKIMDTILQGISRIICYIDDILVTGATEADYLANLNNDANRKHAVSDKIDAVPFLLMLQSYGHFWGY